MSEMIERVARAIYESRPGGGSWEMLGEQRHSDYLKEKWFIAARAAIKAMQIPTEEMLHSGAIGSGSDSWAYAGVVWREMIIAALGPEEAA